MYCYFNEGKSMRSVDGNYVCQNGEVCFDDIATEDQLIVAFNGSIAKNNKAQKLLALKLEFEDTKNTLLKAKGLAELANNSSTAAKILQVQNDYNLALSDYNKKTLEVIKT